MSKTFLYMLIIGVLWLAVSSCRTERAYPDKVFLTKVKLKSDNDTLYYWDLDDFIRQQPNRRILYTFRFHTGIYNLGYKMKDRTEKRTKRWEKKVERKHRKDSEYREDLEKRNRKINGGIRNWLMNTVGEEPVYLDTVKTNVSSDQMLKFCHANGFFDAIVTDTTIFNGKNDTKATVKYNVESGISYRVNKIDFVSSDNGLLRFVNEERDESLLSEGMVYNEETFDDERTRINDLLKKTGYYHFSKAYIRYEVDTTIGNHLMNVKLIINRPSYSMKNGKADSLVFYNHKRYMVRHIYIYPDFEINNKDIGNFDTTVYVKYREDRNDTIYFVHRYPMKIKPKTISRKVFIKCMRFFNIDDARKTQNELSNLNNFKYINVRFQTDSVKDYNQVLEYMDAYIELSRLSVNSTSFEIEGTNSSGNLGMAGNWVFKNRNLFHGAEVFDFNVSGGLELQKSIFDENNDENVIEALPFNSLEFATELKLTVPAFLLPVSQKKFSQNSRPMTRFSSGFSYQLRPDYERYISHFKLSYQWRESSYRNVEIYLPMNLVRISPDSAFAERIQQFSRTIRYSYEDHFIPGIGMLMQFNNQNNTRKKNYSFRTTRMEFAGISLWTMNGFNSAKDSSVYKVLGINYAQYAKFDFDYRYYFRMNEQSVLAFRTFLGVGLPFGNSVILPFEKSYSAGGSNEIRAWKYRSLGPGAYCDSLLYDKTGDIALVMNLEYRFPIVSWFKGAFFFDMGNVWLLNENEEFAGGELKPELFYQQLGLGTGFGLRLDFDFFIIRLDASFALHDPAKEEGHRWVGFYKFAEKTNFNFGIGYPF